MIRKVTLEDAKFIAEIYNYYVLNSIATFQEVPVSETYFKEKIKSVTKKYPWLVFVADKKIIGYAYADLWNARSAYHKTVEVSVYVKHKLVEKGIGSKLYKKLIRQLIKEQYYAIIGGVSLPNKISKKLHEKFGFKKVAHFKEVGFKFNKWIDVGYWQLNIYQNKKEI